MGQIFKKKILFYFLSLLLANIFLLVLILLFNMISKNNVLFFNSMKFSLISSFFGFLVWKLFVKNKDFFEDIVVLLSQIFICLFVSYIIPTTIDRSLSSFIYFYSVEEGKISKNIKNEEYIDKYLERRFQDGEKIGYLKCSNNYCYPTVKTKITYSIFYPIGKITKTLDNYFEFKKMVNNLH